MAERPVLVDITRLLTRLRFAAPTGIDRVELAYARRYLGGPEGAGAVAITAFGTRLVPNDVSGPLLDELERRWRDDAARREGPELARVRAWLSGASPPAEAAAGHTKSRGPDLGRLIDRLAWTARARSWARAETAPRDAVYVHASHLRLDRPERFAWLDRRPDVAPVFFIHDLIPIAFPEYGVPGEAARHRVRMATVARHGRAAITNSQDVADAFLRHLAASGLRAVPTVAAPLGVEAAFLAEAVPLPSARPYLVCCGTIEGRKNHLMLLQLWRDLVARGEPVPALVLVGRRGWESEAATDLLDRCEAIRPHVIEANGLATAELASLVAGARALLMPSFAEGYGIPVIEALSLGTPVIASDIAPHREIARGAAPGAATLLDPLDGPAWREAVLRAVAAPSGPRSRGAYAPATWEAHFQIVDHVLARL